MFQIKSFKFLVLLLVCLFLHLISSFVFGYIIAHKFEVTVGVNHSFDWREFNLLALLIITFLLALIEELMFRFPLKKNKFHFFVSCTLILCWVCFKFFDFWVILIVSLISLIFYLKRIFFYKKWIRLNLTSLIILYNLLFAFLHLANYPDSVFLFKNTMGIVLILTNHLVSGLIFTFVFLKFSIFYSTLIHFIGNSVLILLYVYI
jgi:hypothetical protein